MKKALRIRLYAKGEISPRYHLTWFLRSVTGMNRDRLCGTPPSDLSGSEATFRPLVPSGLSASGRLSVGGNPRTPLLLCRCMFCGRREQRSDRAHFLYTIEGKAGFVKPFPQSAPLKRKIQRLKSLCSFSDYSQDLYCILKHVCYSIANKKPGRNPSHPYT